MIQKRFYLLLKLCTSLILFAKGVQGWILDYPFRVLLWDERLLSPHFQRFGWQWETYVNSPLLESSLENCRIVLSIFFFILSFAIWLIPQKWFQIPLLFAFTILLLFSILQTKDLFWNPAILMEHSISLTIPFLLCWYDEQSILKKITVLKIATAFTFIGHAFFALGLFPIPGDYIQMTINILKIEEPQAVSFLRIIGFLDLAASIFLFVRPQILQNLSYIYLIVWGFLTAFARIVGHYHSELGFSTLNEYWHETLLRLPHGMLPLGLWFVSTSISSKKAKTKDETK